MANCLKTDLDCTLANPLVPTLTQLVIPVRAVETTGMYVQELSLATYGSRSFTITIIGDGGFVPDTYADLQDPSKIMKTGTFVGKNSAQSFYFTNGNYYVIVENKHELTIVRFPNAGLVQMPSIFQLHPYDVKFLRDCTQQGFNFTNFTGYLTDFSKSLTLLSCFNSKISGKIEDLGDYTSLTHFDVSFASSCSGSVEEFVKRQYANGRTSASMNCYIAGTGITFNGNTYSDASNSNLTWSPHSGDDTKIDINYKGSSITIDAA